MINLKKISHILFSLMILLSQANAKSVNELLSILENSKVKFQFVFWQVQSTAFLTTLVPAGKKSSIWKFTSVEKKWQPLYNAGAFDGFAKAGDTFDNVSLNQNTKQLTVGNINQQAITDTSIVPVLKLLENKTHTPRYYFWNKVVDGENISFLTTVKKDGSNSIWHFTRESRKWQPLVNAGAFDGFPKAPKTISGLKIDIASGSIKMGKRDEAKIKEIIEEYPNEKYIAKEQITDTISSDGSLGDIPNCEDVKNEKDSRKCIVKSFDASSQKELTSLCSSIEDKNIRDECMKERIDNQNQNSKTHNEVGLDGAGFEGKIYDNVDFSKAINHCIKISTREKRESCMRDELKNAKILGLVSKVDKSKAPNLFASYEGKKYTNEDWREAIFECGALSEKYKKSCMDSMLKDKAISGL